MTDSTTEVISEDESHVIEPPKTPAEKTLSRLEKLTRKDDQFFDLEAKRYLKTLKDYELFVQQVERWYCNNYKRYIHYMAQYDRDIISEVEFKIAMQDLEVPFNLLQIHILYTWMDPKRTGQVEFARLYEALYRAFYKRFAIDEDRRKMDLEYKKKWVRMTFKSPSFGPLEMSTTFEALIHLGYSGAMLRELIRTRAPTIATRNIVVFTDPTMCAATVVKCHQRLYEFDFEGGPKHAPKRAIIYYEYTTGFIDCPLLMDLHSRRRTLLQIPEPVVKYDSMSFTSGDLSLSS